MAGPKRELTLLDCFGLGINGIIGSGIFLLPAALQRRAGGQSPLAWLAVGGLCTLIALCFAEASSRTDRSGGPYRYAVEAFGPLIGFAVGWITMILSRLGYAAVARGFAEHAAFLVGGGESLVTLIVCVVVLVALAFMLLATRRGLDSLKETVEKLYTDTRPLVVQATHVAEDAREVVAMLRTDVIRVTDAASAFSDQLLEAAATTERRIDEVNAVLDVV